MEKEKFIQLLRDIVETGLYDDGDGCYRAYIDELSADELKDFRQYLEQVITNL